MLQYDWTWKQRLLAAVAAISFVCAVAAIASKSGIVVLLFPELAALSYDVLQRPTGKWATQPIRLILNPTLTAIVGLFVARHSHYGVLPILTVLLCSLGMIRLLRSSIGPAISAGLLPLVLNEQRWLYPVAIFADLTCLVIVLWLWKAFGPARRETLPPANSVNDKLEAISKDPLWLLHLLLFVSLVAFIGQSTGLRLVLFPPLVVMAYEIFGHPEVPVWATRPVLYSLACVLSATMGILALRTIGSETWGVMAVLAGSILVLRIFKIHMPPALAVGLIPFIMTSRSYSYPFSVAIGVFVLSVWALLRAKLRWHVSQYQLGN